MQFIVGHVYNVFAPKGSFRNARDQVAVSENKNVGTVPTDLDLTYLGKPKDGPSKGKHLFALPDGVTILGETTIEAHPNHFSTNTTYNREKRGATKGTLEEQIAAARTTVLEAEAYVAKCMARVTDLEKKQLIAAEAKAKAEEEAREQAAQLAADVAAQEAAMEAAELVELTDAEQDADQVY